MEGGHRLPESEFVRRWTAAFGNLLSTWDIFDAVHLLDSSTETVRLIAWKEGEETRTRTPRAGLPEREEAISGRVGN